MKDLVGDAEVASVVAWLVWWAACVASSLFYFRGFLQRAAVGVRQPARRFQF